MRLVCIVVLSFVPAICSAQAPAAPPPPAREGTAEFAFVATSGNASTQTIGLAGELILRPDSWVVRNRAAFIRNEAEDVLTAESFLYLFRAEHILNARTSLFGEFNYFKDRFAGVSHRNTFLGGIAYKVLDIPEHQFIVDGGLGYLNEQRLSGDDVSSGTYGVGAAYKWKISPSAEFTDDVRFTGTFAEADDWRLAQTAALTTRITTIFSLKVSNAIRYSHAPVPGFKNTDTTTSVALVAKF